MELNVEGLYYCHFQRGFWQDKAMLSGGLATFTLINSRL